MNVRHTIVRAREPGWTGNATVKSADDGNNYCDMIIPVKAAVF